MTNVYKSLLYTTRNTRTFLNIAVKNLSSVSKTSLPISGNYKHLSKCFHKPIREVNYAVKKFLTTSCSLLLDDRDVDFVENDLGPVEFIKTEPTQLYSNLNDPIIDKLNKCFSIQEVFNVLRESSNHLEHYHIIKTVLILWDMQKIFSESYVNNLGKYDVKMSPVNMVMEYVNRLKSHDEFHHLLKLIETYCHAFNIEELSHCVLYLGKMGFGTDSKVFSTLMSLCDDKLKYSPSDWTLYDLARYTASIGVRDNLKFILSVKETMPLIESYLENCKAVEELRLITACFDKTHILISESTMDAYRSKTWEFIETNIFTVNDKDTILKVVAFLNLPYWLKTNSKLNIAICSIIENKIESMNAAEIIVLHKAFQSYLEPANMLNMIRKRANHLLEEIKSDDTALAYTLMPDLLFCQATTSVPQNRNIFEKMCLDLIDICFPTSLPAIYKVLRFLKTSNHQIYDKFWKKSLENLYSKPIEDNLILRICHKYMFFNNHSNRIYRNIDFEKTLITLMLQSIREGVPGTVPWKFSRMSAFIFSYGMSWKNSLSEINMINELMNKLDTMSDQLDILDCLVLSRCLQILTKSTRKLHKLYHVNHVPVRLNCLLDKCVSRHLKCEQNSLLVLNTICKTFINRKARYDTEQFHILLDNYLHITGGFTSRSIRDSVYNFINCNYIIPPFMERAIGYTVSQDENILGETAHKILHLCYIAGYTPKNIDFLDTTVRLIERDKDIMPGLSLIQTCLALCFFGHLPETLVKYIFSIEFMERLDDEIAECYSKLTYPANVRKKLMDLNRSVCLEFPQYQVPWFHEKYIEEVIALTPTKLSAFHDDVLETLKNSLNLDSCLTYPHYTSYGYRVDFMLQLDERDAPITLLNPLKMEAKTKIAILLMDDNNSFFKIYNGKRDNGSEPHIVLENSGPTQSCIRHLEQLGYIVVELSPGLWFSMHMTEPDAKVDYLTKKVLMKC